MIYIFETSNIGSIFIFPTYISTSLNINTAINFSPNYLDKSQINMTKNIRLNDDIYKFILN